ncbi:aminotransferase [Nocardioides gansuensis]|uniref:Aminotransferase n=1 Tax=Nocardioides gansuensis TaxID=2138300 RepID=A0A2T8F7Z6_9ACTN|nr:aminotransferase class I/II-fold pyridoxal phosphate-dependent enzyme [Nocardioides gansuensis]PVG81787.1 aminotransferase [Nocardioides gansuensis]
MPVSPTLAISQEIARRRAAGLDTVALGFGEASIPVHPELVRRLAQSAHRGDYGPVAGAPELLEAVAGYWTRRGVATTAAEVVCGPGSKPLLYALFQALGGPVLLPRPCWVSYAAQAALLGHEALLVPTLPGHGGVPDPERLSAEAARLRAEGRPATTVLVTLPDNPTGTVAAPDVISELCAVAEEHDLAIISDEIYLDLVHGDTEVLTPAEVLADRTITTTGLSKSLALGGWRIGAARIPERHEAVRRQVTVAASEIWSAPAQPVQQVAAWAFTEPPELAPHVEASRALHGRIARTVAGIFTAAGAEVAPPTAGFYLYPDFAGRRDELAASGIGTSADLARVLLDQHGVATLPGVAFGDLPERLALRVAPPMLYGRDDDQRWQALASKTPEELPWIADSLAVLREALSRLV